MPAFIIRWPYGSTGGRYAVTVAGNIREAAENVEAGIGFPFEIAPLDAAEWVEGFPYVEFDQPEEKFGSSLESDFEWKPAEQCLD